MKTTALFSLTALTGILLFGCATVRELEETSTTLNKELRTSIGSIVFQLARKGDLPNAFGGRDIYGGKVDLGSSEVKLTKIVDKRFVHLAVSDERKTSTETTMDRYVVPIQSKSNSKVDVKVGNVNVGSNSDLSIVEVVIDTNEENIYSLGSYDIEITEVRGSSISYIVRKSN